MPKNEYNLVDLYLEQIKYMSDEYISIQTSFLSWVNLPLAALGVLVYYIEQSGLSSTVRSLYLILPFLYALIPYNLIKYSIRMIAIDQYIKHLEIKINEITGQNTFMWKSVLMDKSTLPKGFSLSTTVIQLPIHAALVAFLGNRFVNAIFTDTAYKGIHAVLVVLFMIEIAGLGLMLVDLANTKYTIDNETQSINKK